MRINSELYTLKETVFVDQVDLVLCCNYVATAVVAKTAFHTALAVANFYWCIILLAPTGHLCYPGPTGP